MIANQREENENYPLTTIKIAKAQKKDQEIKIHYKQNAKTLNVKNTKKGYELQLFEDTKVLCKDDKFIIPVSLWQGQSVGITTTSSTLATHALKRQ